jgi:vitamin B12 transporter
MRSILLPLFLTTSLSAFAAPLIVKVTDPFGNPVHNARVSLVQGETRSVKQVVFTDPQGSATLAAAGDSSTVEVLAPGFAPATANVTSPEGDLNVQLKIASSTEAVTVTAAATELSLEHTGPNTSVITGNELLARNPVAAANAIRYVPGVVIAANGRRGSLSSTFVRGGESRYNKVIVDGVTVNDPGGTFDFGVVPVQAIERIELLRGPGSTLYGSDAMTSVIQLFSQTGSTSVPEFTFGADGGTFGTAHGFASLAGAWKRLDYNLFADQLATEGQGINDEHQNASQGGNLGVQLSPKLSFRLRARHANSRTGIQNAWVFNQQPLLSPDTDQYARQNNFLASGELTWLTTSIWKQTFRGGEYDHHRRNVDNEADRGCEVVIFDFTDCFFDVNTKINRATFDYQGELSPRSWLRTIYGYQYENENGNLLTHFLTLDFNTFQAVIEDSHTRGLRQNHALYIQQFASWKTLSFLGGVRYVHNDSFGNRGVPQASISWLAIPARGVFSGTRLRFSYGEGIKEPRFEESFGVTGTFPTFPNPDLKSERNRAYEAGLVQGFGERAIFIATYFRNDFREQIFFNCDPVTFQCRYQNLGTSLAHGAEIGLNLRATSAWTIDASYTHTSSQVLESPQATGVFSAGEPLLRRPKHAFYLTSNYFRPRWGLNVSGVYVGSRADSDFFTLLTPITVADAYSRVDFGGWYRINRFATAYANAENIFNRRYEEVLGYPALKANFRAGMRFRVGGAR